MGIVNASVNRLTPASQFILGFILLLAFCLHAVAQQPAKNSPANGDTSNANTPTCPEAEQLRKNVQQLTGDVQRLKRRVADLEKDRLATTIQEQLEKEEQRGEALQLHLFEIAEKEAPLQSRMEQINQQLKPETLERTMAGVGSVHPEDARDEVRKRLTTEKQRLQSQLELFRQDRARTQSSLATTDAAIQRLKQKLAEALRP
jgi:chromosome segregation ATPase